MGHIYFIYTSNKFDSSALFRKHLKVDNSAWNWKTSLKADDNACNDCISARNNYMHAGNQFERVNDFMYPGSLVITTAAGIQKENSPSVVSLK